jgi:hypothetical protein
MRSPVRISLAMLCLATVAVAEPDPALRGRVEGLLGSYRTVREAQWRALGPDAAPILASVVTDPTALPTFRARALAALGVVDAAGAAPHVQRFLADASAPRPLRAAAIGAAPGVLGEQAALPLLRPLLVGDDWTLSEVSARALSRAGAASCAMLKTEAKRRPDRESFARSAAACEARLRAGSKPAE